MSASQSYLTVEKAARGELVEKKSRFIGRIAPVKTEREALDFIAKIRGEHRDATHNVFAFMVRENHLTRFSDDGEPQGTGGKPVLAMLQKEGLVDVAVVVTRYFGGTLLGTGGLVWAYGGAAKLALQNTEIIEMALCLQCSVVMPYHLYDIFLTKLPKYPLRVTDTSYTDHVTVELVIRGEEMEPFVTEMEQMGNGVVKIFKKDKIFSHFKRE